MATATKKKLITEVEEDLYTAIKDQAEKEERSVAAMIRHVLRSYLDGSLGETARRS